MHLPGRYVHFRFSFSPQRSSKARLALEQLFGDGKKFRDGNLAQRDCMRCSSGMDKENPLNSATSDMSGRDSLSLCRDTGPSGKFSGNTSTKIPSGVVEVFQCASWVATRLKLRRRPSFRLR